MLHWAKVTAIFNVTHLLQASDLARCSISSLTFGEEIDATATMFMEPNNNEIACENFAD